jgi:hypothetical protein
MKNKYKLIVLMSIICNCALNSSINAFNDTVTHRQLTEAAINTHYKISLVAFIGYSSGYKKTFQGKDRIGRERNISVLEWFQEGSTDEDNPLCRATNHFHNPTHSGDWTQSKMSDSLLVSAYS